MGRRKATVTYTVKAHPGVTITVPGKVDDEKTRASALDEALRLMTEETGPLDSDSFPDGLGVEDLIFVEASHLLAKEAEETGTERELEPMEKAAKTVAEFTLKRAALQQQQANAQKYLGLIEAVFSMQPLTGEQIEMATDKAFPKTLENLASAKIEFDKLQPQAEDAWKLLKPAFSPAEEQKPTASNGNKRESEPVAKVK